MDRPIDKHRPGRNHILKLWNERQADSKSILLFAASLLAEKLSIAFFEADDSASSVSGQPLLSNRFYKNPLLLEERVISFSTQNPRKRKLSV